MRDGLEIKSINKTYGDKHVVRNISFAAQAGQILGMLGPNGAGKTTTIRMIMGITAPDSGEIWFTTDNHRSNKIPWHLVGYLPEERGLYKEAKVMQVLQFIASLKNISGKTAKARAMEWLQKFDLQDYAYAKIEQLSKGMSQKVQFIASILHEPKFIVLDEPFSGLDPVSQDTFKTEIKNLAASGAVVLLSSHRMNIVEELCDRIFLIHQGKEVVFGTLNEIKQRYGNYRVRLETKTNIEQLTLPPIIEGTTRVSDHKWILELKDEVTPEQFVASMPKDIHIEEINIVRPSLHDIFVRTATGGLGE